jgi:hypothetical protein
VSGLDVAAALRPLFREYVRRLDEMATRLPADALLRETTNRGPAGELNVGPDGLPVIYDVADLRTLETFVVHGSHPDQPAVPGGTVGKIEVDLKPGNWESLPVNCRFDGRPSDRDLLELAELIRAWALIAAQGGFAQLGGEQLGPWTGRLHAVRFTANIDELTAILDLGTCPPGAVAVLLAALDGFGRDARPVAKVVSGGPAMDEAAPSA